MQTIYYTSFGNRYTKAREFMEYLDLLPNFNPGVDNLLPNKVRELITSIEEANTSVASKNSILQTERDERLALIRGENGLISRASQIRDYLASILPKSKKAKDYERAQKIVQRMRGVTKKPSANADGSLPSTNSTIEVSYGSILSSGRELLEVIKLVPGYAPSNANLTVTNFEAFLNTVSAKNSAVLQKREQFSDAVEVRANLYDELKERIKKIKSSIAAQYGKQSNEYKDCIKY